MVVVSIFISASIWATARGCRIYGSADAALVLVGLFGQVIGFGHVIAFGLGQIRMYRVDEVFEFDIFIFKFHNMKPPHSLQYNSYVGDA